MFTVRLNNTSMDFLGRTGILNIFTPLLRMCTTSIIVAVRQRYTKIYSRSEYRLPVAGN